VVTVGQYQRATTNDLISAVRVTTSSNVRLEHSQIQGYAAARLISYSEKAVAVQDKRAPAHAVGDIPTAKRKLLTSSMQRYYCVVCHV
jgi:hypothetical protein